MEQEPTECRRKPYRPWLSDHLMLKRHVQNVRKTFFLSVQSVSAAAQNRFYLYRKKVHTKTLEMIP